MPTPDAILMPARRTLRSRRRRTTMLLDIFLPESDVRTQHVIRVNACPGHVYASLWSTDFDHWGLTRALYAVRTLPALAVTPVETWRRVRDEPRRHFTLQDLLGGGGFGLLAERSGDELVIGTVGRFWRARGQLCAPTGEDFSKPTPPGMAKAAWNFAVREHPNGGTELWTETRVLCADSATRWRFRAYWTLIRPFSGLIRREMLAAVRAQAETTHAADF
jgi:hypothetical protein